MSRTFNIIKENNWFVGEDKALQFTVYQADDATVANISGWTTSFQLAESPVSTPIFTVAGVTFSSALGLVDVAVPGANTRLLKPGTYNYSFRRTNAGFGAILSHGTLVLQRAAQSLA